MSSATIEASGPTKLGLETDPGEQGIGATNGMHANPKGASRKNGSKRKVRKPKVLLPDIADTEHIRVPGFHIFPRLLDSGLIKALKQFVSVHPARCKGGFAMPIDHSVNDTALEKAIKVAAQLSNLSGEGLVQLATLAKASETQKKKNTGMLAFLDEACASASHTAASSIPNFLVVESFQPPQGHNPRLLSSFFSLSASSPDSVPQYPERAITFHVGGPIVLELEEETNFGSETLEIDSPEEQKLPEDGTQPAPKKLVRLDPGSVAVFEGDALTKWSQSIDRRTRDACHGINVKRGMFFRLTFLHLPDAARQNFNLQHVLETEHTERMKAKAKLNPKKKLVAPPILVEELICSFLPGSAPSCSGAVALDEGLREEAAAKLEKEHVVSVYDKIAKHFSHTRYKPWPQIEEWVRNLPAGNKLADIGCGNGKYMRVNSSIQVDGCDISAELVKICRARGLNVVVGDALDAPFPSNSYDFAMSIAVLHHISTVKRRLQVMKELLRVVKPGGRVLLCAWAKEQAQDSRREFAGSDVWVPWVIPKRYYLAENEEGTSEESNELAKPSEDSKNATELPPETTVQRYCHVYENGELEQLLLSLKTCEILRTFHDSGNHCVEVRKLQA